MKNLKKYVLEYSLILCTLLLSIGGFWNIYFGAESNPTRYQTLHVVTSLIWLFLLLYQLDAIAKNRYLVHRKVGLAILFLGTFLVASTALLSVHSAYKGLVSGEGDFLIVQNVMGTLELAFIILMAFILKKNRKLHGAFLLSTALLFLGIALFFTMLGFVPQFRIEGPDTFYRFGIAAAIGRYVCFSIGLLFFLKDRRNGWPLLLVGSFFIINDYINTLLNNYELIRPLTEFVGSLNEPATFVGTFAVLLILLTVIGVRNKRPAAG